MLDEVKKVIGEDVVIVVLGLACLFAGLFGSANWQSHCSPHPPVMAWGEKQEIYDVKIRAYEQEMQNVGKDAVIPRVWAIPMALVGFAGALVAVAVIIHRNQ